MSIKHSLLALLADGPATASNLQQRFHDELGGLWPLNPGQIAQTLSRFERDGWAEVSAYTTGPTGRKAAQYQLTDSGHEHLAQWWSDAVTPAASDRDELVVKVAFAAQRDDVDVVDVLDSQRFATVEEIRKLTQQAREIPQERTPQRLAVERRIFELEAQARWLDRVEALAPSAPTAKKDKK